MSQKLIQFKIDPALDRIWTAIGYDQVEKAGEAKKLETTLIEAYQNFMQAANSNVENLRAELKNSIEKYHHTQEVFGDESTPPKLHRRYSLRQQIDIMNEAIDELNNKYEDVIQKFSDQYEKIQTIYQELKVDPSQQGEFAQIGYEDLTPERLERFQKAAENLEHELEQRQQIFQTLGDQIDKAAEDIEEELPNNVKEILDNNWVDNDSIATLKQYASSISNRRSEQHKELTELWDQTVHYYTILGVILEDRLEKPEHPSIQNIEILRNEIEFLESEKDTRLPVVTKALNQEIKKLCEQLRVPKKMRPRYTGTDLAEESLYLKNELDRLKEQLSRAQPILQTVSDLEAARALAGSQNEQGTQILSRERGASRRLAEDEKRRREAKAAIPKLQQKLLKLLARFKEENGYDFEFDFDIGDALPPEQPRIRPARESLSKTLLRQKLNEMKESEPRPERTQMRQTRRAFR